MRDGLEAHLRTILVPVAGSHQSNSNLAAEPLRLPPPASTPPEEASRHTSRNLRDCLPPEPRDRDDSPFPSLTVFLFPQRYLLLHTWVRAPGASLWKHLHQRLPKWHTAVSLSRPALRMEAGAVGSGAPSARLLEDEPQEVYWAGLQNMFPTLACGCSGLRTIKSLTVT